MATQPHNRDSYGLSEPIINVQQAPIISIRNPTGNDKAQLGTEWVNTLTNTAWILTSIEHNVAEWANITIGNSGITVVNTDSGPAVPSAGAILLHGTGDVTTSGSGSTVTIAGSGITTVHDSGSGTATASSNAITITGGTGITTTATGSTVTVSTSGASITSLTADEGSATTASSIAILTGFNNGFNSANGTAFFASTSSSITLNFTSNDNTVLGGNAGFGGFGSPGNTGLGSEVFNGGGSAAQYNTAIGTNTMDEGLTTGSYNVAIGAQCGRHITTGNRNIFIGYLSGNNYDSSESSNICLNSQGTTTESNVLRIGTATGTGNQDLNAAYICGITGIVVSGVAAQITSGNQLGVASSSQRFKNDIQAMNNASEDIYKLSPVTFNWNKNSAPGLKDAPDGPQPGLIAEEVYQVMPNLVVLDNDQKPLSVKYELLIPMLLNEVQRLNKRLETLEKKS